MRVEQISMEDIDVVENVRLGKGDQSLKQLMESILQHGLKEPIGVSKEKDGKYVLLYGFRRYSAYKKLGNKTIPAVIDERVELKDRLIINMLENVQRRDVSPFELGRVCDRLLNLNLIEGEIAARLNVTLGMVKKALAVFNKVPKKYKSKIVFSAGKGGEPKAGNIAANAAYQIIRFSTSQGLKKNEIEELLESYRRGKIDSTELENITKLIRDGNSVKDALKISKEYKVFRVDITIKKDEYEERMKSKNIGIGSMVKMAIYGIEKPFTKPYFIKFLSVKEQ